MSAFTLTRRDFLRTAGSAAVALSSARHVHALEDTGRTARVVLVRNASVIDAAGGTDPAVIGRMLDDAMTALWNVGTPKDAWTKVAGPEDSVGIKTNVWRHLRTPPELEQVMTARLATAGVGRDRVGVDDRGVLSNPQFQSATVLINVRPMRAHHWSGVGGCLKNYIMFVPRPSEYHGDSCRDLGAIWRLPVVEGKTRLNVLVMLTPQFHCRGPHHFDREFTWSYGGMLVGTDPVALDAVGLKILEAKRRRFFKEESPIRAAARHITAAEERHGVGVADLSRIEIIKLGWSDGVLI